MHPRKWMLPLAASLASAIIVGGPARAADPTQVSGHVILKDVQQHVFPIGSNPDHVVVVVRAMGANRNTGSSSFLDGALMTSTYWIDMTKGIGQARGYVAYEAADRSWLMSVDEKSQMVMVDEKKPLQRTWYLGVYQRHRSLCQWAWQWHLKGPMHAAS